MKTSTVNFKDAYVDPNSPMTSGQVATECKVAPRTAAKWVDSGRLKGYRLPGSQDRRVNKSDLYEFMKVHGMPISKEFRNCMSSIVAVYAVDSSVVPPGEDVVVFDDPFEFGACYMKSRVSRAVIGDMDGVSMMVRAVKFVRSYDPKSDITLFVSDDVPFDLLKRVGLDTEKWERASSVKANSQGI